jgi:hypothetical protein
MMVILGNDRSDSDVNENLEVNKMPLWKSKISELKMIASGKVRDIYDLGDELLIVTYVPASGLGTDSAMTYYLRQDLGGGQSCILARYNHCNLDENQISKTCP